MNEEHLNILTEKMLDLYVSVRKKFIRQKLDGSYSHSDGFKTEIFLGDKIIKNHILGEDTVGIFCPKGYTKFVTFDIDCEGYSEEFRREIVLMLKEEIIQFGINKEDIHTSFSGSKGYHLQIFFSEMVSLSTVDKFYVEILTNCNLNSTLVELYPRVEQGLKIPLSVHRKTGNRCWFVDECFNKIESPNYILGIEKVDRNYFQELVKCIKPNKDENKKLNIIYSEFSTNKIPMLTFNIAQRLEFNGLTEKSSRNYSSMQLATLYNTIGLKESDALNKLNQWISDQNTEYFKTPLEQCYIENSKIIKWVYKKGITFYTKENEQIYLYKKELDWIGGVKDKNARHLLFSMLCHYKRYNCELGIALYMTYTQISLHSKIKKSASIKKAINILSACGYLEILSEGVYDSDNKKMVANKYKLIINESIFNKGKKLYTLSDYISGYMNDSISMNNLLIL